MIPHLFSSADGDSFGLDILGYELADVQTDGGYDWLMVGIRACHRGRCWDARFPCLRWDEATQLSAWLDESANNEPEQTEIGFTEPNLRFEYLSRDGDAVRLRVLLSAELQPPWQPCEPGQRRDPRLDFECTLAALNSFARLVRERLAQYPKRRLDQADSPSAAEPADNGAETAPTDQPNAALIQPSDSRESPDIADREDADSIEEPDFPDLYICVGQSRGRLPVQSDALLVGGRVFQEKAMQPWTSAGYSVREPCVLLGIAEGVPGLPRPNAVAKCLLQAVAELDGCDEEPLRPVADEILRSAHKMLCEEADLRRFAGGAARVALAEVRIDRVVTLYTATAGIYFVDRRSGEATPLATRGHTPIGDTPTRGAIIANPEESDFPVYRTQAPLTCHQTVVLCSDRVTALVAEREIGPIVKNAEHRDDAAEAILDAVDARGGSDNASIIVCDFTCPAG